MRSILVSLWALLLQASCGSLNAMPVRCTIQEVSRQTVRLDAHRTIYVEPQALAESQGNVLLAGAPNYIWSSHGDSTRVEQNPVLGVILSDTGYAREIRVPIDANRIRVVRAVTQGDGSWAIVFVEMASAEQREDEVAHLWFGIHDGHQWKRLEHIPLPSDGVYRTLSISSLARGGGDTLSFAIPVRLAAYDDLVVFIYDGKTWTHEVVPTRRVAYAEPAFSQETGWMMAVVQPDTTVESDGNALFLYARNGEWKALRKIDSGRMAPIHDPELRLGTQNGGALGWLAFVTSPDGAQRSEARVSSDPLSDPVLITRIDSAAESIVPVVLSDGRVVWLTDHYGADGHVIRFFTTGPERRVEEIGRVPNLFQGQFGAVALPNGGLLISGPLVEMSGETITSLTTQVVHVAIRCTPDGDRAPRGAN